MTIKAEELAKTVPGFVTFYELDPKFKGIILVILDNNPIGFICYTDQDGCWYFHTTADVYDSNTYDGNLVDLVKYLEKQISKDLEFKVVKFTEYSVNEQK